MHVNSYLLEIEKNNLSSKTIEIFLPVWNPVECQQCRPMPSVSSLATFPLYQRIAEVFPLPSDSLKYFFN